MSRGGEGEGGTAALSNGVADNERSTSLELLVACERLTARYQNVSQRSRVFLGGEDTNQPIVLFRHSIARSNICTKNSCAVVSNSTSTEPIAATVTLVAASSAARAFLVACLSRSVIAKSSRWRGIQK